MPLAVELPQDGVADEVLVEPHDAGLDGQPVLVVERSDAPTAHDEIESYCAAAGARPRWIPHGAVQVERVLKNVLAILKEAKMGPEHVVKATVYLVDLADFPKLNEVYGRYLGKEPPARSTVQVAALPKGARVEIDVIAAF